MIRRACGLVLVLAGCGRIGFAPVDSGADDTVDADPDAAVDASVFEMPFGEPAPLATINSTFDDDDPSMTGDGLELYFASRRLGNDRTFRARRAAVTEAWSAPVAIEVLGVTNNPRITLDGLTIYFATSRAPSTGVDIWRAVRASRAVEFDAPSRVVELATAAHDFEPAVADDTGAIVFCSERDGNADLWMAPRNPDGSFGPATRLAELATPSYEGSPWASADATQIWFHRLGELLEARRASTSEPFGTATVIPGLASAFDDQDPWVSPDGRTIVFASNRAGNADIYMATR